MTAIAYDGLCGLVPIQVKCRRGSGYVVETTKAVYPYPKGYEIETSAHWLVVRVGKPLAMMCRQASEQEITEQMVISK